MNTKELYKKLISDTLILIKQDFYLKKSIKVSRENYSFFAKKEFLDLANKPRLKITDPTSPPRQLGLEEKHTNLTPTSKEQNSPKQEKKETLPETTGMLSPSKIEISTAKKEHDFKPDVPLAPTRNLFLQMRKAVKANLPKLALKEDVPSDDRAKQIAGQWKHHAFTQEVLLFIFNEKDQELSFLKNLAQAVNTHLKPAQVIDTNLYEKERKWKIFFQFHQCKLIICSEKELFASSELKNFYVHPKISPLPLLGNIPTLLLSPYSSYASDKAQKQQLWNTLCQRLKN
jgi:hypothetical protein